MMSDNSRISWTQATWNPLAGCTKVSPGCEHCYAEVMSRRLAAMHRQGYENVINYKGKWNNQIDLIPSALSKPLHWKKPRLIFVNSMSDLFHKNVPEWYIASVFEVMMKANWHTYQVLTKRPERMHQILDGADWWNGSEHIWLGTTMENQTEADERAFHLRRIGPAVRFLSLEPMLEPIEIPLIEKWNWVIVGGESGPGARPFNWDWARSVRDQCREYEIPFFMKQGGGVRDKRAKLEDLPNDLQIREFPR
jgi:protein gp37